MKKVPLREMLIVSLLMCFYSLGCSNALTDKPFKLKYLSLSEPLKQDQKYERHIEVLYKNHSVKEFAPDDKF